MSERHCTGCGEPLTGRRDQKYCGKRCQSRIVIRNRRARLRAEGKPVPQYRNIERERASDERRKARRAAAGLPTYNPRGKGPRGPRKRAYPKPLPERVVTARRKVRRYAQGTTGKKVVWGMGWCAVCRAPFVARANGNIPKYCSSRCSSEANDYRVHRRHRLVVYERDGGTCMICGDPCDMASVVPDNWAPTLDHIIPRSHGGPDTLENLRLAHFICNSRRGAPTGDATDVTSWIRS